MDQLIQVQNYQARVRGGGPTAFLRQRLSGLALLLGLWALLLVPSLARAQAEGVIEGVVTLGGDAALPGGLEAELLFLPNGQGPPAISAQPLAEDGSFRFEAVDTAPQHRYLVRVTAEGEETYSDLLAFSQGEATKQVAIQLFARTTDASLLSLPQVSFLLDVRSNGWVVAALYQFDNASEQTIVNLTQPPATLTLPEQASNIQFSDETSFENIVDLPNGFAYAGPFPPGESAFLYSYSLPYQAGEQSLTLPLGMTAQQVRILVPELGQSIETDDLPSVGTQEALDGRPFRIFQAAGPPGGQTFTFRFGNLPPPPTPVPGEVLPAAEAAAQPRVLPISPLERLPWWAPLLPAGIAAAGVAGYLRARPSLSAGEQRVALWQRRNALIAELAALDERFEARAIGEQTHARQRAVLKQELRQVLQQLGSQGAGSLPSHTS